MAGDIKLKAGTTQTLEANGASVTNTDWGTANDQDLDNTTQLAPEWNFELNAGFGASVSTGQPITLVLVPKLDGTNAGDIDTTNDKWQPDHAAGTFRTAATGTTARLLTLQRVPLGPFKYTAYLFNEAGVTISAGWALKAYPVLDQYT